jgi:tRNA wybutosine-synthesizing protein 3
MPLPTPHATFLAKKSKILSQLSIPDAEYTDASPKGSVDEGIRDLIDEINRRDGLVTTSSCAGRVSVFVEGSKKGQPPVDEETRGDSGKGAPKPASAVGGKGGGGTWLFVSHDAVDEGVLAEEGGVESLFGLERQALEGGGSGRLIHFKFEPMVC